LEESVKVLTNATNEELRALYCLASLLLFPSIIEGFGWPIAEAQACGCPVVTTFNAPMTEVGGHAAVYINPEDTTHAAELINGVLHEPHSARMRRTAESLANAARFSPDQMIEGYLGAYHSLLDHKPRRQEAVLS
jgi:glycosyltransferase involved in cell wall biosynthesis